ncbi:MAG: butyrate kinase [Bacteroidales bacterium]|jgi:butyrate kinase|nr:butyrate kinase [Bacteroidales bacterium]
MAKRLLVINPGSTSTKISIFEDENQLLDATLRHTAGELAHFTTTYSQKDFRKELIIKKLAEENYKLVDFDAIVGRGGMVRPLKSGTYIVNDSLLKDLTNAAYGEHASNLGAIVASELIKEAGCKAYISDPVVVDELHDLARISGLPQLPHRSVFHALNQKATARKYCKEIGQEYKNVNILICHMGGGISVGVHTGGKIIDVNNCVNGTGAFSPERSGTLPADDLVKMCFSGKYSQYEINKMINGKGGLMAHLGMNQAHHIVDKIEAGDTHAGLILDAMAYNVAKEIGAAATVLKGKVDAILLTGGIAYNDYVCERVISRIDFIAPVKRYPGEDEMGALASNTLRVLNDEEDCLIY